MVISLTLDSLGMQVKMWHYLYPIVPYIPAYLPYDMTLMPVSIMFLLQFKPDINPIYKGVAFGFLAAFVGEPFFKWLDIYDPLKWKYIYSFPFYILIYLGADWISKRTHFEKLI